MTSSESIEVQQSNYEEMGQFEQAEPLYQQVLKIRRDRLGELHPDVALSLNNLAVLQYRVGDYSRAELLYRQALEIARKVMQPQDPDYGLLLNNFAALCCIQADYVQAEPLYREALEINSIGPRKQGFAYVMSLNNLAALYKETGDYDQARSLYERALTIHEAHAERDQYEYAATLNNLADVCSVSGDEERAERLYLQALETWKASSGERTPGYANGLSNLAELFQSRGEPQRALPLLHQSIEIRRVMLGAYHPDYAYGLNCLAEWHAGYGDTSVAEGLFEQALEIRQATFGDQHPEYALSLHSFARFHCLKKNPSLAADFASRAASIIRQHLNVNSVVQSERQQRSNQATERPLLDRLLVASLLMQGDQTPMAEALWEWKGAVTARQRAYRQVAQSTALAPLFADLQNVSRKISVLAGQRPVVPVVVESESNETSYAEQLEAWNEEFESLSLKRESLERQIAAESNDFKRMTESITVDAVRQNLTDQMAYVDFFQYRHEDMDIENDATKAGRNHEQRFLAVIVRRSRPVFIAKLGAADAIGKSITEFRRQWHSDAMTGEVADSAAQAAREIRRMLWDPVDEHLDGVETVIISPDGILGALPFAALPGKKAGGFLIEDYALSFVPTVSELQRALDAREQPTAAGKGLLIVGDVNYDAATHTDKTNSTQRLLVDAGTRGAEQQLHSAENWHWAALPGFAAETQRIHDLFENHFPDHPVDRLTGSQATEAEFLTEASGYGTLHLVTHGYFEDFRNRSPAASAPQTGTTEQQADGIQRLIARYLPGLLSGLVMAGANHPSVSPDVLDDGILRSSEIEASSMQGVDLVVLSACETGLGAVAGGEGLSGLQRAFQVAGARSVVASLWKVDDAATLALMTEFYTNLWVKKQSKIDSLRNAQLTMLRSYDPKTNTLRRGLGTKPGKVAAGNEPAAAESESGESRLDPALWAAFQLSGDWR